MQIRGALVKCRAQLAYIVKRSEDGVQGARYVDRARQGELTEVVIHAVITVQALSAGGGTFKTHIARAYARGVAGAERAQTLDSVRSIIAVLDNAIAGLSVGAPMASTGA
jgi:hypothetical protein